MSTCPTRFWVMSPRDADNIAVGMCPFRPLSVLTASVLKVRADLEKWLDKFQATRDMIDHATIQWSSGENSSAEFNAVLDGVLEVYLKIPYFALTCISSQYAQKDEMSW